MDANWMINCFGAVRDWHARWRLLDAHRLADPVAAAAASTSDCLLISHAAEFYRDRGVAAGQAADLDRAAALWGANHPNCIGSMFDSSYAGAWGRGDDCRHALPAIATWYQSAADELGRLRAIGLVRGCSDTARFAAHVLTFASQAELDN